VAFRDKTTPRQVPAKILQVSVIPCKISGKIVEFAVRDLTHGKALKKYGCAAESAGVEGVLAS
jgi:acetoacetyl-CoA synthetase